MHGFILQPEPPPSRTLYRGFQLNRAHRRGSELAINPCDTISITFGFIVRQRLISKRERYLARPCVSTY
jgi:hypothetical protein